MPSRKPLCSMCGEARATIIDKWPGPVCADCDDWLTVVVAPALDEVERQNPEIAKARERVERSFYNRWQEEL